MKQVFKLLLLLLLLTITIAQADSISTIQLRNRPAAEIIPVIKPFLEASDAISGQGFKIFLRASPETLAQIKEMIKSVDIAAKILQISVYQGSTRGKSELGINANIQAQSGDTNVNVGGSTGTTDNTGGNISFGTNNGSASIGGSNTRIRLNNAPIHQIRVAEGTEAYIETGRQIPVFTGINSILPRQVVGATEYKKVVTGFYVLPRIHGDTVTLQVSPFKNNTSGSNIETQSANTTITGRIGQWLLIGGATEQLKRKQSSIGSQVSTQSRNNESIWIKADLIQ